MKTDLPFREDPAWKDMLDRISSIRETGDYSPATIDFIRECLQSFDDRVRGGAALAAEGCLFEPYVLDLLITIAEQDSSHAVRKAALQSLEGVIDEGIERGLEDEDITEDFELQDMGEWSEYQAETLRQDYFRVKNLLVDLLQNSEEDMEIREVALKALSGLGFHRYVREWISEFFASDKKSSRIIAVLAMGKYPQFWEEELAALIIPDTDKILLMEAISACYSSESELLASKIEKVLETADADPDVMVYALYTLANINRTENLGELLQKYSLHSEQRVREAARKAIDLFSQKNFDDFLHNDLGYEG